MTGQPNNITGILPTDMESRKPFHNPSNYKLITYLLAKPKSNTHTTCTGSENSIPHSIQSIASNQPTNILTSTSSIAKRPLISGYEV